MKKTFFVIAFLLMSSIAMAAIPKYITVQGRLTLSNDVEVPSGSYDFSFSIWDDPTSTNVINRLWTEQINGYQISNGLFTIELGRLNPLILPFDKPYFLEVWVGSNRLWPRVNITSSGYAFVAGGISGDLNMTGYNIEDVHIIRNKINDDLWIGTRDNNKYIGFYDYVNSRDVFKYRGSTGILEVYRPSIFSSVANFTGGVNLVSDVNSSGNLDAVKIRNQYDRNLYIGMRDNTSTFALYDWNNSRTLMWYRGNPGNLEFYRPSNFYFNVNFSGNISTPYKRDPWLDRGGTTWIPEPRPQDINRDGLVDQADLSLMKIGFGCQKYSGDDCWNKRIGVDNLGNYINVSDLDIVKDANNIIDIFDITNVALVYDPIVSPYEAQNRELDSGSGLSKEYLLEDINKDGFIDSSDFSLFFPRGDNQYVYGCLNSSACWNKRIGIDNVGNYIYVKDLNLVKTIVSPETIDIADIVQVANKLNSYPKTGIISAAFQNFPAAEFKGISTYSPTGPIVRISNNDTAPGNGHGLWIQAGNTAVDKLLLVKNRTGDTFFEIKGNGIVSSTQGIQINTTDPKWATCDETRRGTLWYNQSAPGGGDSLWICLKTGFMDVYDWRKIIQA